MSIEQVQEIVFTAMQTSTLLSCSHQNTISVFDNMTEFIREDVFHHPPTDRKILP
jgi:hypothetical protein